MCFGPLCKSMFLCVCVCVCVCMFGAYIGYFNVELCVSVHKMASKMADPHSHTALKDLTRHKCRRSLSKQCERVCMCVCVCVCVCVTLTCSELCSLVFCRAMMAVLRVYPRSVMASTRFLSSSLRAESSSADESITAWEPRGRGSEQRGGGRGYEARNWNITNIIGHYSLGDGAKTTWWGGGQIKHTAERWGDRRSLRERERDGERERGRQGGG